MTQVCANSGRRSATFPMELIACFETLKTRLVTAPLLCYPDFDKDFVLETDASKQGLGSMLSQYQVDHKLHPVAYASRSISSTEANYAITDLETLAVVWAVTHFCYYLYGHTVTIITDHAAVKAILGAPSLSGKHARWWSKVHGSGIKQVEIVHRSGKKINILIAYHANLYGPLQLKIQLMMKSKLQRFLLKLTQSVIFYRCNLIKLMTVTHYLVNS